MVFRYSLSTADSIFYFSATAVLRSSASIFFPLFSFPLSAASQHVSTTQQFRASTSHFHWTVSVFHRRQETRSIKRRTALSGNEKRKRAPGPDRALHCDFTAVRFDNVFAKDQANSGGRVGVGVVIEASIIAEEHLLILRRDTDPLINHGKARGGSANAHDFAFIGLDCRQFFYGAVIEWNSGPIGEWSDPVEGAIYQLPGRTFTQ